MTTPRAPKESKGFHIPDLQATLFELRDLLPLGENANLRTVVNRLSNAISNTLSALGVSVAALSQQVSIISQQVSVLSQAASVLSNRVSVNSGFLSTLSLADTTLSNAISNELSVRAAKDDALSNAISVLSSTVSTQSVTLGARIDTQSQGLSVLSQQVSVLSQGLSVVSNALSVAKLAKGARIFHSLDQIVSSGVVTPLTFDSERFDTSAYHESAIAPTRLSVKVGGVYLVAGSLEYAPNATGVRVIHIRLNGTTLLAATQIPNAGASNVQCAVATVYKFAAIDYVELTTFQNSGSTLSVLTAGNYSPEFQITRLGLA